MTTLIGPLSAELGEDPQPVSRSKVVPRALVTAERLIKHLLKSCEEISNVPYAMLAIQAAEKLKALSFQAKRGISPSFVSYS
jgi:hypothetical protein